MGTVRLNQLSVTTLARLRTTSVPWSPSKASLAGASPIGGLVKGEKAKRRYTKREILNRDRTIRTARIVDVAGMLHDPIYRSVAESALKAVLDPECSPLNLPPQKYKEWRTMIVQFDPDFARFKLLSRHGLRRSLKQISPHRLTDHQTAAIAA